LPQTCQRPQASNAKQQTSTQQHINCTCQVNARFRYGRWVVALAPMSDSPRFGFVTFAETWNGRLAMLGFVIGLGTELLTGQSILGQLGLG
jgi:ferrochelatase